MEKKKPNILRGDFVYVSMDDDGKEVKEGIVVFKPNKYGLVNVLYRDGSDGYVHEDRVAPYYSSDLYANTPDYITGKSKRWN